jgi:shikimate kinase
MHAKLQQTPAVYLVGFMGSGKSTVGKLLAQRLGWEFVDLDDEIERRAGRKIADIFSTDGEPAFRELEHQAVAGQVELTKARRPRVVALGGGAFVAKRNRELLATAGLSIYLECPEDILWERIRAERHRPLAQDRARFQALCEQRRSEYQKADLRVDAARAPQDTVESIVAAVLPEKAS